MMTTPPIRAHKAVVFVATVLLLAACSSDDVPGSLQFADDSPVDATVPEAEEVISGDETSTTTPLLDLAGSDTETDDAASGPTTTQTPPPPPLEPTLEVECATNPRTVTVTFADDLDVPLEWELSARRLPGGPEAETVIESIAAGEGVPEEPMVHEVVTNDLTFIVSSTNASGSVEVEVDVDRYTGCPVAASFEGRIVEQIDCVSGAFRFSPAQPSDILVDSVVIDRVSGTDVTLQPNLSGTYLVPGWTGPEEVKAVVTFTDPTGLHAEHINHWCFGGPFGPDLGGDYKVCADEAVMLAYPGEWFSSIDLGGSTCEFFRYGPVTGTDSNVTLRSLGATTLAEATASLLPPGPWMIADQEVVNPAAFSDRIGTISGGERIRFELSWDNAPSLVRRVVWLVEVEGVVWRLEANIQGLEEIDGMANSLQFLPQ